MSQYVDHRSLTITPKTPSEDLSSDDTMPVGVTPDTPDLGQKSRVDFSSFNNPEAGPGTGTIINKDLDSLESGGIHGLTSVPVPTRAREIQTTASPGGLTLATAGEISADGGNGSSHSVSELVGRTGLDQTYKIISPHEISVDRTRSDYEFYDKLRRGQQAGYKLGGLFSAPIALITLSWMLGRGVRAAFTDRKSVRLEKMINDFLSEQLQNIIMWAFDSYTMGDGYLAVNSDRSLTQLSPATAWKHTTRLDYKTVERYEVQIQLEAGLKVTDDYYLDRRVVTIQDGTSKYSKVYRNPTGRFLIQHYPNDIGPNEVYGHVIYESLIPLFGYYDDVMIRSVDGVKLMGHPIPVAEGLHDPLQTINANATGETTYTDKETGTIKTRKVIDFRRLSMMLLGEGGRFKFASPPPFTHDSVKVLEYLFYLMLQRSNIPEWAWGGAIASSKASVEAQMPAFLLYIEARRRQFTPYIIDLIKTWLAVYALSRPALATAVSRPIELRWPDINDLDNEMMLQWVSWAYTSGLLTPQTALALSNLVENPELEIEQIERNRLEASTDTSNQTPEQTPDQNGDTDQTDDSTANGQ